MSAPLLEARGLHVRFGGVVAADGVDLAVRAGEHLAVIGPNGAGKTTFLNLCTGYVRPARGTVLFGGRDITTRTPRAITRMGIARAFQIPQLFLDHTALENLLLAAAARTRRRSPFRPLAEIPERDEMRELLALMRCAEAADRPVAELPEGVRKLVDIALALALRPKVLLLDEPTSGVSSEEKFRVMDTLAEALARREVTAVFVEHDMAVVERYADRVAVWSAGRIRRDGPPAEVLADPEVRAEVMGA